MGIQLSWSLGLGISFFTLMSFISNFLIFFVGAYLLVQGEVFAGLIFAMYQLMQIVSRVGGIANSFAAVNQSQAAVAKMYQV